MGEAVAVEILMTPSMEVAEVVVVVMCEVDWRMLCMVVAAVDVEA